MQRAEAFKLWRFWRVLAGEIERDGPLQRIRLVRDVPRQGELADRVQLFWRAELRLKAVPTLLLDADLDPIIARTLWPQIEIEAIAARRHAEVIQVFDTVCSRQKLIAWAGAPAAEERRAAQRLGDVQALLDVESRRGPTLLVTYKAVAQRLRPPTGSAVVHFGALRGIDRYRDFQTVIIAGREQPAASSMEQQGLSFFGDIGEALVATGMYVDTDRGYRRRAEA